MAKVSQKREVSSKIDHPGAQCVDGSPQYMLPLHVYLWQEDVAVGVDAELSAVKAFVAAYAANS